MRLRVTPPGKPCVNTEWVEGVGGGEKQWQSRPPVATGGSFIPLPFLLLFLQGKRRRRILALVPGGPKCAGRDLQVLCW